MFLFHWKTKYNITREFPVFQWYLKFVITWNSLEFIEKSSINKMIPKYIYFSVMFWNMHAFMECAVKKGKFLTIYFLIYYYKSLFLPWLCFILCINQKILYQDQLSIIYIFLKIIVLKEPWAVLWQFLANLYILIFFITALLKLLLLSMLTEVLFNQ